MNMENDKDLTPGEALWILSHLKQTTESEKAMRTCVPTRKRVIRKLYSIIDYGEAKMNVFVAGDLLNSKQETIER